MSEQLRLYIWEGDGISDAYHDDGTLVVLAESPEQARELVARDIRADKEQTERLLPLRREFHEAERKEVSALGGYSRGLWTTPEGRELTARRHAFEETLGVVDYILPDGPGDGYPAAMDRDPDRVVELSAPCIVAFNGGGYD